MRRGRRVRRSEEGSALIIALIFITVISVAVAAILSFSEVGLKASKAYNFKERAKSSYAGEGGVAAAIQRYSTTGPCNNFTTPLVKGATPDQDSPMNERGTIVRCEGPQPAGRKATQPVNALLSLGAGSNDGIKSTQELHLIGDVFSNTTISPTATMVVQEGEVSALGTCTGPIQTVPATPLRCVNTNPPNPPGLADPLRGRDPYYSAGATTVPVRRTPPLPDCSAAAGWLVEIEPGFYDDAEALSAHTGPGSCNDKVVWFKRGTYYFDLGFRGGSNTWLVTNPTVVVVGGTPKNADLVWNPVDPRPTLSVPGSCDTSQPGVQLVAGGATQLRVEQGRMELCATPSANNNQQIALFGLGPPPDDGVHRLDASDIASSAAGFAPALNAQTIEESPAAIATATLTESEPAASFASIAFEAFRPGVPSGSVIEAVSLVVRHREPEVDSQVDISFTADFTGSTCKPGGEVTAPQRIPSASEGLTTIPIDLVTACGSGIAKPEELEGLAVTYDVALAAPVAPGAKATPELDGLVMEVTYRIPSTRKPTVVFGTPDFSDPPGTFEIGEPDRPISEVTLDSDRPSASIELAGYADPPLPGSATVSAARLRVAHRDQAAVATVTLPFRGRNCELPVPQQADLTNDRLDLANCLEASDSPNALTAADLNGLSSVRYTAALVTGGAAVVQLDGIWLEVVAAGDSEPAVRRGTAASPPAGSPPPGFDSPQLAEVIDQPPSPETSAVANLSGATNSMSLRVGGFNRVPVAAWSRIDSVKLRVAHREDAGVASIGAFTDAIQPNYPTGCQLSIPSSSTVAFATHEIDLVTECPDASKEDLAKLDAATLTATRKTEQPRLVPGQAIEPVLFESVELARAIDGEGALAAMPEPGQTASVKLGGYSLPSAAPQGTVFDIATLRIAHREADVAEGAITATVTVSGTPCVRTVDPRNGTTIIEDVIDLQACGLNSPEQLADLSVVYQVAGGQPTTTAFLDGVVIDLTYRPPAVDLLEGIELVVGFQAPTLRPLCPTAARPCDLLIVAPEANDSASRFVAAGTVYAPSAGVEIAMNGLNTQVLQRGLIARSISLALQGSRRPVAAIPPETVTFTAYPDETLEPATAESNPATAVPPATVFSEPNKARTLREPTAANPEAATANLDTTSDVANIELSGFVTDLPDDADVDVAALRVRHKDNGNTVEVTVKRGTTTCVDRFRLAPRSTWSEDQIDLRACDLDRPTKFDDVKVAYTVTLDRGGGATTATAELDGITLEVLSGPLVRATATFDGPKATVESWNVLR